MIADLLLPIWSPNKIPINIFDSSKVYKRKRPHMSLDPILNRLKEIGPCWYVQTLKMFGDTLHGSIVVAHYNQTKPANVKLVWGLSERYIKEYDEYLSCDHKIAIPHGLSNPDRVKLAREAEKLPNVQRVIKPLVGVWGWHIGGSIADNVFHNAGIQKLAVPRKPILPVGIQDYAWADDVMRSKKLVGRKYGVLEYNSYSLSGPPHNAIKPIAWYNKMLSMVKYPIVFIGGKKDPKLKYGTDMRGCTFRQSKILIQRSKLMIGCGSGLTMVACSDGVNVPLIELGIGHTISMGGCGYGKSQIIRRGSGATEVAGIINRLLA
jgi:hypothetical protein